MSGASLDAATWGAAAVAAVVAFLAWFPWLRRALNHVAFADQIIKLCKSDNVERAKKLCKAAPRNPMVAAVARCLDALDQGGDEPQAETIARLREIYRTSVKADLAAATAHVWIGLAALTMIALDVYLVVGLGGPRVALALDAVALIILVRAYRLARRLTIDPATEEERLLPVIAAARKS